ncbi:MAG: 50S ribosomal protein L25/general stress protein Ctc [Lautropia sp.]|nr:50S ribosomal protein L25/general stress protein Ctc [Lautropia sp.]
MKVVAEERKEMGSGASRRLRRAAKVPGIVYGGDSQPVQIALDHNPLYHSLRVEAFHASILDMELGGKTEQVLLRDVQWHPYKPQVLHVDFQRVAANQKITIKVPFHFMNQENSPAVKENKAVVNHVLTEIEITCLPADLPEYIEVDLGGITLEHSLHLSAITLPPGITPLLQPGSDPVIATAAVVGGSAADNKEDAEKAAAAAAPAAAPAAAKAPAAAPAAKK